MVCIYCGVATSVVNSRQQRRNNSVWRRRKCSACQNVYTSIERPDLAAGLRVQYGPERLEMFNRDRLFISIYESCKHRPGALHEAANLTQRVINHIVLQAETPGLIQRTDLVATIYAILHSFDGTAATVFAAYHPLGSATS